MNVRICPNCNEKFIPKRSKQVYCNMSKEKKCEICGKLIQYVCNSNVPKTCSPECQVLLIKKNREQSALQSIKICKWCGKEFKPKSAVQVYCEGPHYRRCAICRTNFEIDPVVNPNVQTCSKDCMKILMSQNHDYINGEETNKQHLLEKYGVTNVMNIPGVIEKIKQANIEKYETEWFFQSDEYRQQTQQTSLMKYGTLHPGQAQEVKNKRSQTSIEKYGVDNPAKTEEVKEKIRQTNLEKYGVVHPRQNQEVKDRTVDTNIKKYGVKHPMLLKEFQNKAVQTNIEKYGRAAYTQQHIKNIQNWYLFINDPEGYIADNYKAKPRTEELANDLGVDLSTVDVYLNRHHARDCVRKARSLMEDELREYISELVPNAIIISNDKTAIKPLELDLYLPEYNFAIECNPTATHNSSVADPWGSEPKSPSYHKQKTDMCEDVGITLFHIFGYDWIHKKSIIKSMIKNHLNQSGTVIYARKCKIVENVSWADAFKFLQQNHRQGVANSPIRIGLEYEGQLVSLMTFGKMRGTIGTGNEDLSNCYELVRFCSLLNTTVVGGASRLFKHFINNYSPVRIRSFSDRAHTSGQLYPTLGFTEVTRSQPGYVWVNVATDRAYHRANAQKQNLKRFLKDDDIDLTKTEMQIMVEHGFVQVFDSGTITWEWLK